MSAFVLYKHKQNPLSQQEIKKVAEKLIHFPWVKTAVYSDNKLQLIYTENKTDTIRIFKDKERGLLFFLHGNIFESSSGIARIDDTNPEYTLEQQLINHYNKGGISSCTGLNGMYNLMVWNEKEELMEIAGDKLGIFQIFFTALDNRRFVITTDIVTLKYIHDYNPKISKRGIFDILYMGIAFENRTILEDVERLLPNACYRILNNELKLIEKFRLPFSQKRWGYLTSKILDELSHCYIQAIKRQLNPSQKVIFLQSGGKDSRLFSYFLKQSGIIPQCLTVGETHHGEVFLAKNVCKILGLPWQRFSLSQNFNSKYAQDFLEIDSFSGRIFSPFLMEVMEKIASQYDYSISTFLGDPIFGSTIKKAKPEKENSMLNAFNSYMASWRASMLTDNELRELLNGRVEDFIQEYKKESIQLFNSLADEPYQSIIAFGLRLNDRFKVGGVLRSINAALPVRLPCIDNDLMDFLFSLPPVLLQDRHLIDVFLVSKAEKLAALPLDQNSFYYTALVPSLKSELRLRLWHTYATKIKLPILRYLNPISATTQSYVQIFSLRDSGFQQIRKKTLSLLPLTDGVFNIPKAKYLLEKEPPTNMDHIMPGNAIRSLITSILATQTFQ